MSSNFRDKFIFDAMVPLFLNVPVVAQFGFRPKKLSWNCFRSPPDFGTRYYCFGKQEHAPCKIHLVII